LKYLSLGVLILSLTGFSNHAQANKQIAITIDDLPFSSKVPLSINEKTQKSSDILSHLTKYKVKAVGFVNEDKILTKGQVDGHISILDAWLDQGMELGNHNFGHKGLWKTPLADYQESIIRGETITQWLLSERDQKIRYYRHPYTQTGKDDSEKQTLESFLKAKNYQVAPFTMEHDDYLFSCVYDHYLQQNDQVALAKIKKEYLAHLDVAIKTFEIMSEELFERNINHIFLLHANALNADTLGDTLASFKQKDYEFISLDEALKDPVYQLEDKASKRFGPSWLMRWAKAKKQKLSVYGQPEPKGWTAQQYKKICR